MDRQHRPDNEHQALLAAYRDGERMPPGLREAAWQRLRNAPVVTESPAPTPARRRDWVWGVALVAAAVLLLVFGGRRSPQRADEHARSQAAHDIEDAAAHAVDVAAPRRGPAPTIDDSPRDDPAPALPRLRPRVKPSLPPSPDPAPPARPASIDAELALVVAARAALTAGTPARALPPLAEHARTFPAGDLIEERMRLEVEAQCALGRRAEARAAAKALQSSFPRSPHAPAVAALCAD